MRSLLSLAAICVLAPCIALPQQKVAVVEGITEYSFPNGLRVLLFPDPSKPLITINITYNVGSRHENYGETGMAHLLEHMLFKGTEKHHDVAKEIGDHGGRFNASTFFDRTNYFEILQASDENLRWALEMEADRMLNSRVSRKDLDSEMTVVRNEFERGENNPTSILEERVLSTAYLWHNYGKSTIGARADIENVPIERLQAFYHNYYQPDNATLVVAGKIDETKTLALIKEYFGSLPKPTRKLQVTYTQEPTQDGERTVTLRRAGGIQALGVAYHVPAGSDPDYPAVEVLNAVLSENPSGRLYKALVESRMAASVSGEGYQLREPGIVYIRAEVPLDKSLKAVRDTMLSTIEGVIKEPPTKDEVERARTALLKQIELGLNNSTGIGLQLSEWSSMGDWRLLFLFRDQLKKVTAEDVLRVAKAYFRDSNRTIGEFIPETNSQRAEIPAPPDVAALVKDYKGSAVIAQGEAFDPSPANIDARTKHATLPSGLKLAMLSKKNRGAGVNALIVLHFGDLKSLQGRLMAAQFTSRMLIRGTKEHNRQQIQDELNRLRARLNVTGGVSSMSLTIETVHENLPAVLKLAAEILREPSFPDTELEQIRLATLAQATALKTEPQPVAANAFAQHEYPYPKGDPRATMSFDEEAEAAKKVTLEEVKKFYADFAGASSAEMTVVGDFDPAEVQKLAGDLLGNWKSPAPYARITRPWQKITPVNKMIETPDKQNSMFFGGTRINMADDDPDYPAMIFANFMIGQSPSSRLFSRIREKDGLSYGTGSFMNAQPQEQNTSFGVFAICAPQNILKVEAAYQEEIQRAIKDGFPADEVEKSKTGWKQLQATNRSQDAALTRELALNEQFGRTMAWDATFEARVLALTPEQISAAFRKHFKPEEVSLFKAGDFKKAGITK